MNRLVLLEIDCQWDEARCQKALPALPPEVQARAQRYRCPKARRNLLATQTHLRAILDRLKIDQERLRVCPQGRPYVVDSCLEFNLSHSESRAVLAVAWDSEIEQALGVDIEWMNRRVERDALAERFFSEEEFQYVRGSTENFFRIWTRKEAILKSNGIGLRVELNGFEVLEDQVNQEVTGRPLTLGTSLRDDDYLVSWAVPQDWSPHQVLWIDSESKDCLQDLAEGIGAAI